MSRPCIALAMAVAFGVPITSFAATIDFDDAPVGALSDFYQGLGVRFSTVTYDSVTGTITPVAPHAGVAEDPSLAVSDPNVLYAVTSEDDLTPGQAAVLLSFVLPGTETPGVTDLVAISLDALGASDPRDDLVELFALGEGNEILAVDRAFDTEVTELRIQRSVPDIARAVILFAPAPGSTDYEGYDNLEFGEPVPDPATLSLLAIGGMAVLRRRR